MKHGPLPSPSRRSINTEAHVLPSRLREASEGLPDVADTDSSIEIIEGNMFCEKGARKSKPIHPFFLQQYKASSPNSDNKKVPKHDKKPVRTDNVLRSSLNHTNATANQILRRDILKKAGKDIEQGEEKKSGNNIAMPIVRTEGKLPKRRCDVGKKSKSGADTNALPTYSFMDYCATSPAIVYTRCEDEANRLVESLESPLGFDLEWRVLWHSGAQERRTALVQLCDESTILLIQVNYMNRFPQKVWDVIESPTIIKTGSNILNDGEKLYRDFGIIARGLVELGALAHVADDAFSSMYKRRVVSLAKMAAFYLNRDLVKSKERTSNWEGDLNDKMVQYAANDAHAALMIHLKLLNLAKASNKDMDASKYTSLVDPRSLSDKKMIPPPVLSTSSVYDSVLESPRPQYMRAYNLWYHHNMPLDKMCDTLKTRGRVEPLKRSTVISYVVGAIQADTSLPFDMDRLLELVRMEAGSWQRHRVWLVGAGKSCCGYAEPTE